MANSRGEIDLELLSMDDLLEGLDSFGIEAEKVMKVHKPSIPRIPKQEVPKDELDKLLAESLGYVPKTKGQGSVLSEVGNTYVSHSMFKPVSPINNASKKPSNQRDFAIEAASGGLMHSRSVAFFSKSAYFPPTQEGWLEGSVRHYCPESQSLSSSADRPTTAVPSQRMVNQLPPVPDSKYAKKRSIFQTAATSSMEPPALGRSYKSGML